MSFDNATPTSLLKREINERLRFIISCSAGVTTNIVLINTPGEKAKIEEEYAHIKNIMNEMVRRCDFDALPERFNDIDRLSEIYRKRIFDPREDFAIQAGLIVARAGFGVSQLPLLSMDSEEIENEVIRYSVDKMFGALCQIFDVSEVTAIPIQAHLNLIVQDALAHPLPIPRIKKAISDIDKWDVYESEDVFIAAQLAKNVMGVAASILEWLPENDEACRVEAIFKISDKKPLQYN